MEGTPGEFSPLHFPQFRLGVSGAARFRWGRWLPRCVELGGHAPSCNMLHAAAGPREKTAGSCGGCTDGAKVMMSAREKSKT